MITADGVTYCIDPLEVTVGLLSKRWVLLVVAVLGEKGGLRFGEARQRIPGITPRALSAALRALLDEKLVVRTVDADKAPPAVQYALSPRGTTLRRALIPLLAWTTEQAQES